MYHDEYQKMLENMKTAAELTKDYNNLQRCEQNLKCYIRAEAWQCLQDMIKDYWVQIEFFGQLFDGIKIYKNVDLTQVSDETLLAQLRYIAQHIPAYILLRKGEEELAKGVCDWLTKRCGEQK